MGQLLGVDVSGYQPSNIFDLIGGSVGHGWVKATQGTDYVSSECDGQVQSLLRQGKKMAFYGFLDPADPVQQADYFCKNTDGYFGKGIPTIDFEGAAVNYLGGSGLLTCLERVKENKGINPIVYMSLSVAQRSDMKQVADANFGLWVAYGSDYTSQHNGFENVPASSESGQWPFAIARQFTDNIWLPGYADGIDGDVFYGDESVWDAYVGGTPSPAPAPTPAPPAPVPAFPLPGGCYAGPEGGPVQSISGYHGYRSGVQAIQQRLKDRGWDIGVDGLYGYIGNTSWTQSQTGQIIHAFQVQKGLVPDGLAGINTWTALWQAPIT